MRPELAIALARDIFPRLSFDLIYARPGQRPEDWREELLEAIDLAADHLSLYQLTIEEGTPFFDLHRKGRILTPDADQAAELYELTDEITSAHGMPSYEISNYAADGQGSVHNLVYWRYQDYAGIGPGAHGRLTVDGKKLATACERNPEIWWQKVMVDGHGLRESETLSSLEASDEFLLMGLRLREGIDPARFEAIVGAGFNAQKITQLAKDGLLEMSRNGKLRATKAGSMVLDALVADLAA